ncbi:MAG: hypothetical protein JW712_11140 [Dehalococcoidales bacterium]|nr:hypothetical protein [Dehalococcoidales bacterium]
MKNTNTKLIHEEKRVYRLANRVMIFGSPLMLMVAAIFLWLRIGMAAGLLAIGLSALIGLVFWFVTPQKYRVYDDHLTVAYGKPLGLNLPFDSIISIKKARSTLVSELAGAGSAPYVLISTKNRPDYYVFARDVDSFFTEATKALETWRGE